MIRGFLSVFLLTIFAASGIAQEQGQLDASPALFSVLAAINAAGYDAEIGSPSNSPVREMVRREVAAANPPCMAELKRFYADHRQKDPTADLSQYVAFALSVSGPPGFAYRYKAEELRPDVAALDGFRELLVKFYQEARIEQLWSKAQPAFEAAIERYHGPAVNSLIQVNAYLRSAQSGALGSRFQIYVDLLGAPNQVQSHTQKNDYFVVVTPSAEPQAEDIRHAYLHYQLDALAVRYAADVQKNKGLLDYAQGAPALDGIYKNDFLLLSTECLIKAIESRLAPPADRQRLAEQALKEGFVLAPGFAEALAKYEKQEQSLRFYYPELVGSIDLAREATRLDAVEFAQEKAPRKGRVVATERPVESAGANKTLEDAERLYAGRDLANAKALFLRVLKETDEKRLHAQAYYGLARIAALEKDLETAEQLFGKTLQSSPDPQVKAWAYVYLGRLADLVGQREQATEHYRAALAVEGASQMARQAAEKGLASAFRR